MFSMAILPSWIYIHTGYVMKWCLCINPHAKLFCLLLAINKLLQNSKANVSYIAEHFFTIEVSFHGGFMVTCAYIYLEMIWCYGHVCVCVCVCVCVFSLIIIDDMFIYIVYTQPGNTGEQKTKPTQHSVRQMRGFGLSPDIVSWLNLICVMFIISMYLLCIYITYVYYDTNKCCIIQIFIAIYQIFGLLLFTELTYFPFLKISLCYAKFCVLEILRFKKNHKICNLIIIYSNKCTGWLLAMQANVVSNQQLPLSTVKWAAVANTALIFLQ